MKSNELDFGTEAVVDRDEFVTGSKAVPERPSQGRFDFEVRPTVLFREAQCEAHVVLRKRMADDELMHFNHVVRKDTSEGFARILTSLFSRRWRLRRPDLCRNQSMGLVVAENYLIKLLSKSTKEVSFF